MKRYRKLIQNIYLSFPAKTCYVYWTPLCIILRTEKLTSKQFKDIRGTDMMKEYRTRMG